MLSITWRVTVRVVLLDDDAELTATATWGAKVTGTGAVLAVLDEVVVEVETAPTLASTICFRTVSFARAELIGTGAATGAAA